MSSSGQEGTGARRQAEGRLLIGTETIHLEIQEERQNG